MENRSLSINSIIDKIRRNTMLSDIPKEAIVDYTADFIRIVDTPATFDEKTAIVEIEDYRGVLPCDFLEMIQVRSAPRKHMHPGHWTHVHDHIPPRIYRNTTDSFHLSPVKSHTSESTYKIQGEIIYTSHKHEDIEIAYRALAVDENGFPLIPDSPKFERALINYIKLQHYTNKFEEGKMDYRILEKVDQEYCWAVGAYETECAKLSLDKARSISNIWSRMLSDTDSFRFGYANAGSREYIKVK